MLFYGLGVVGESEPLLWVLGQQFFNEISEQFGGSSWESDDPCSHILVQLGLCFGEEGRNACVQFIQHNSVLVPVGHPVVSLFVDNLERQVGRSPAETFVDVIDTGSLLRESKVSEQGMPIWIEHDVIWLHVTIDDFLLM